MENQMNKTDLRGKAAGKLTEFLKAKGCVSAELVAGPNGNFVSCKTVNDSFTLPVGKKSQGGKLVDMNVMIVTNEDGSEQAIATINNYETVDSIIF